MRRPSRNIPKSFLAFAAAVLVVLAGAGGPWAYTVVTRDGHLIQAQAKPEIRGLHAFMRLAPHGRLAVIQEEQIDWERTEAANPAPPVIAIPSDTVIVQEEPDSGASRMPVEVKITGSPSNRRPTTEPDRPEAPGGAGRGAPDQKKVMAQEAIIKLQKEHAQVAAARDAERERGRGLEEELASLQSRDLGYAGEESSARKRIRELHQLIAEANGRIGKYESRLSDIRAEAVQLGGSID